MKPSIVDYENYNSQASGLLENLSTRLLMQKNGWLIIRIVRQWLINESNYKALVAKINNDC